MSAGAFRRRVRNEARVIPQGKGRERIGKEAERNFIPNPIPNRHLCIGDPSETFGLGR